MARAARRLAVAELLQILQVNAVRVPGDEIDRAYWRRLHRPPCKGRLRKLLRDGLIQVTADSSHTLWVDEWTAVDGTMTTTTIAEPEPRPRSVRAVS